MTRSKFKINQTILTGLISAFILSIIFLNSLIFNLNKPLALSHGDVFLVNFILNHYMTIFSTGDFSHLANLEMFFGFSNSLFFTDHHLIQALLVLPIFALTRNIILSSNILFALTLPLSFLSMFLLAFYLTKNRLSSILAGLIFVFNPFTVARFPDHLILYSLMWIPLIFLFFEKSLKVPNRTNILLFFLMLSCQLLSSLYYSAFLSLLLPIYLVIRIYQTKFDLKLLASKSLLLGLVIFIMVASLSAFFYQRTYTTYQINRDLNSSQTYSAWPSDLLFAGQENLIYGGLRQAIGNLWPQFVSPYLSLENNFFWGVIPLVLFILGFFIWPKSDQAKLGWLFLGLILLSLLMSFGPNIQITDSVSVPGPYRLIHAINPLFGFIRAPARFGVFVFFFLALLIGLTWQKFSSKLSPKLAWIVGLTVLSLICVEYLNKPLEFTEITVQTKDFYQQLAKQNQIKVIVDLPIGNERPGPLSRATYEDSHYLLLSLFHHKKLLNGYSGFIPAQYYARADKLTINFPTKAKLALLKSWGVDGIVLHLDEYKLPELYDQTRQKLNLLNVPEVLKTDSLALFDLTGFSDSDH